MRLLPAALAAALLATTATACVRTLAVSIAADALAGQGTLFASDDDPELIREAIPFGLKTIEGLIEASPRNPKLLLAAASGFTQYAYAFVQQDAERLADDQPSRAREILARARKLYARARGYGMRGLDALHEGFAARFEKDRKTALGELGKDDVPLIYWTAAAWAAQISISKNDALLLGDLPAMEALMARALALDEAWGAGAIHEFYVSYEGGRSEASGGSVKRAREHLERALALSRGRKIAPLVAWAEGPAVIAHDRKAFDTYLDRALAFDPDRAPEYRLANLIAQDRARRLKARVSDLFADD